MINPFKQLDKAKKVINDLTFKLKYSKNKVKDGTDINTLIKTVKLFDSMLVSKYKTDAVNTLIYSLIYKILMENKAYKKEIPLHQIINELDTDIFYGAELKKKQVISILKTHELNNKIKNNSVFDKKYANFGKMLDKLVNEFKQDIVWSFQKK